MRARAWIERMALIALAALAGALEVAAARILPGAAHSGSWLPFWMFHLGASLLAAPVLRALLPPAYRQPRATALALLVALAVFLPFGGALGVVLAARLAHALPVRRQDLGMLRQTPQLEVFAVSPADDSLRTAAPAGQTARIARDQSQPQDQRIRAVLALRDMPPRLALPVMRRLLSDPDEEIRLLAYGISSAWEQRLSDALQDAMRELRQAQAGAGGADAVARSARRVAEMHMESIYQGLAQGDLRAFALDQALHHCGIALEAMPRDTGLRMMFLRLSLAARRIDDAREALRELAAQGAGDALWRPYAAEVEWGERHYDRIAPLLAPLDPGQVAPRLRPLLRTWNTRPDPAVAGAGTATA